MLVLTAPKKIIIIITGFALQMARKESNDTVVMAVTHVKLCFHGRPTSHNHSASTFIHSQTRGIMWSQQKAQKEKNSLLHSYSSQAATSLAESY